MAQFLLTKCKNNVIFINSDLCNNLTVGEHYDIYYYNESYAYWIEYDNGDDIDGLYDENNIANTTGRGFLYANVTGGDFAYKGHLYSADVEVHPTRLNEDELAGFNLLGNPFSHDIYKGKDGNAIIEDLNKAYIQRLS